MILRVTRSVLIAGFLAGLLLPVLETRLAVAYVLTGQRWCDNDATLSLQTSAGASSYILATQPVYAAASHWSGYSSNFNFTQVAENSSADVWVFSEADGIGNYFAITNSTYAWPGPCLISANVTYNTSYSWNPPSTYCDYSTSWVSVYTAGLHELGHSLGLAHSDNQAAVMYQFLPWCADKYLNQDDIDGIRDIYDY